MAFADKFKELRQSKNVSQKDLATYFNVAQTTISKWEKGERTPNYEMLKTIADYFQVNPNYFLVDAPETKKFNLQLFNSEEEKPKVIPKISQSELLVANSIGHVLTLKDEKSKKLTLQIMEDVLHLTIPQLEALSALIKTIK